jgi:hypothetical protein
MDDVILVPSVQPDERATFNIMDKLRAACVRHSTTHDTFLLCGFVLLHLERLFQEFSSSDFPTGTASIFNSSEQMANGDVVIAISKLKCTPFRRS